MNGRNFPLDSAQMKSDLDANGFDVINERTPKATLAALVAETNARQAQDVVIAGQIAAKQDELVSGTNIKTINGESILGSGNIEVRGGGEGAVSSVNGQTGVVNLTSIDIFTPDDITVEESIADVRVIASRAESTAEEAVRSAEEANEAAGVALSTADNAVDTAHRASANAIAAGETAAEAARLANSALDQLTGKLGVDDTAADSAKLGGVDAGEYALKTDIPTTDIPTRVRNDADTSRIDGEGNVYDVTNTPTDNYITVTYTTGLVRRYNYNKIDTSGNYEFKFTGGNEYIQYNQNTGYVSVNYSRVATANKVNPLDDEQIVVSSISATNITSIVHTPQKSAKTEEKTDRLARESQLADKLDKTGDTMTGPLKLKTTWLHLYYGGREVSSDEEYCLKLHYDGTISHINPDTGDGEIHVNTLPEKDGTLAVTDELGYLSNDDAWGDPFGYGVNYITLKNRCFTSATLTNAMVQEEGAIFIVCDFSFPSASTFDAVMVLEVSSDVSGSVPYSITDNGAAEFGLDWTPGSVRTIEGGKKYLFSITTYKRGSYAVVSLQELSE